MIPQSVSMHGSLNVKGGLCLDTDQTDFPAVGRLGTLIVKGANLYAYLELNGLRTWYPLLRNLNKSYIHVQGSSNTVWTIQHDLDVSDIWWQAKDVNGAPVSPNSFEKISDDQFKLYFNEPVSGTVVVVGPNAVDVPSIKTSLIELGANVQVDTTGLKINGVYVTNSNGSVTLDFATKDLHVAGNAVIDGTTTLIGPVVIQGATTRVDSTTVSTKDNLILLNEGQVGDGVTAGTSGVEIDRGDLPNFQIVFDEIDDMFKVGEVGDLEVIATQNHVDSAIAAADVNSGVTAGTYGSSTLIPEITVNAKGKISNVVNRSLSIPSGSIILQGDINGSGNTGVAVATALSVTGVIPSTYTKVTVDDKGRISAGTSLSSTDIPTLDAAKIQTGVLASERLPVASTVVSGTVRVDGVTITINNGIISGAITTLPYDIYASTYGLSADADIVTRFISPRAFTIPANYAGSVAKAGTAPTASAVFAVKKNGTQVATVSFTAGNVNGTFSTQAAIGVAVGDVFTIEAPATADTTLADVDFAIIATLN